MVNSSFDVFIKKSFLLWLLLFGWGLPALGQPLLSLDWMNLEPQGFAIKIKHDSQGNIIVLGNGGTSSYARITVIKYNKAGNQLWKQVYITPSSNYRDIASDIEVDSLDNIYIAGTLNYDGNGIVHNSRSVLLKYDSLGTLKWNRQYGSNIDFSIEGSANSLKIFQNKYIYLAGYIDSSSGNALSKSFLAQYDSSGVLNWTYIDSNSYKTFANDIVLDKSGSSYLCGVTACCAPAQKMFVTKFDLLGNKSWNTIVSQPNHQYTYLYQALIDDSANIFLGGETVGTITNTGIDCYVSKIDSAGNIEWGNSYFVDSTSNETDGTNEIIFDAFQDCYLLGYSGVGSGQVEGFVVKFLNSTGEIKWSDIRSDWDIRAGYLAHDSLIVVSGGAHFNNGTVGLFVYGLDTLGNEEWTFQNECECLSYDLIENDSSFFATGINYQPFNIGQDSIMTIRINFDTFSSINNLKEDTSFDLYPNPFNEIIRISKNFNSYNSIEIYNILGYSVYSSSTTFDKLSIDLKNLEIGVYVLEIKFKEHIARKKIIKY